MRETFEHLVARVNASAYIPNNEPSANSARRLIVAKQVKLSKGREFSFKSAGGGGASKYPWDAWFNGDLLLLEQSLGTKDHKGTVNAVADKGKRDFEVDSQAMRGKLKTAARRRYKVCEISYRDADGHKLVDSVIVRARDMTPDERQAEDILRAEEKEAAKTRRDEQKSGTAAPDTVPMQAATA